MTELSAEQAHTIALEAFVFGYPLVLMDVSCSAFVNGQRGTFAAGPANELMHLRTFPPASFKGVVSPNADTLYSIAWLDLSDGPVVLSVPDSAGRYYLMPMLSAWTDVFASPGTRTTGNGAGSFAVVGPGWDGELPAGVPEIRSPTSMVWLIGRTQTNGVDDYEAVHRFQDGCSLEPLSGGGTEPSPPDPSVDSTSPPPEQVAAMDAATFFTRLAALMVDNPPAAADAAALDRFAAIGLTPGSFTPDPSIADALDEGVKAALPALAGALDQAAPPVNGWSVSLDIGAYGTDYGKRAAVALFGLGANLPEDAVYPHTRVDGEGRPLDGANRYVLHFERGQTPPAAAFWSLTMYDEHQYFVENPIDRYAIGDRDELVYGEDGSLDLWLQHDSPGADREANWLPAPAGAFNVILRIYRPKPEVVDGSWSVSAIRRLD